MGVALEVLGGLVAHQFEGVAPFEKGLALCRQAFEFDRLDLRAILFALEAPLGDLVVVEFAFDPVGGAMEEVDRAPEQFFQIWFEAGVGERHHEGVEDVGDAAGDDAAFRKRSRVGFVFEGTVAVELEFLKQVIGRRGIVVRLVCGVVSIGHGDFPSRCGRAHRGLHGDEGDGRAGPAPAAKRRAGTLWRMLEAGDFASRCKAPHGGAAENRRPQALPVRPG